MPSSAIFLVLSKSVKLRSSQGGDLLKEAANDVRTCDANL